MRWFTLPIVALLAGAAFPGVTEASGLAPALEGAWARSAEIAALTARRAEILARKRAAGRITPAPPALTLGHLTDLVTGNDGYREYEVEVGTPLWLPGEATAIRRLADTELAQLDAQLAAAGLAVAGEVRDAYWRFRRASVAVEAARRRLQAAGTLEQDLARQVAAGQVARADLLLAIAAAADARTLLISEEASLAEARLAFLALTGTEPPDEAIEPEDEPAAEGSDPRLLALQKALEVTEATHRLLKVQDRDSPAIALKGVFERELSGESYDKRIGVQVVIPFATEGRNEPRRTLNEVERSRTLVELRAARSRIDADVRAAEAELAAAREQAALAQARVRALAERLELITRSVRAGESALAELIRARADLEAAEAARAQSEVAVMQARSKLNQARGVALRPSSPLTEVRP